MHPARLRRVPSLHHCSRGPPRRAIPGPSRLSRHPCRSTPSTTIPLGLLMGPFASSARLWARQKPTHPTNVRRPCRSGLARDASAVALLLPFALPFTNHPNNAVPESRQEAERRCCVEERLAWMPNEERWARDGPPWLPLEQHRSDDCMDAGGRATQDAKAEGS